MADLSPPPISSPLIDPRTGNGTTAFKNWLVRLYSRAGGGITTDLAPAEVRYVVADADTRLPNAQALNELANGFLTHVGGVISSAGTTIGTDDLDVTGASAGTYGSATTAPVITVGVDGRITSASSTTIVGTVPGGAASGDLSNSYPSPTVAKIQGVAVSSTNATAVSNLTGVNSGDQTITLTGNVTGTGTGSFAATIGANQVAYSMLAQDAGYGIVTYTVGSGIGTPAKLTLQSGLSTSYPSVIADAGDYIGFAGSSLFYKRTTNGVFTLTLAANALCIPTFNFSNTCLGTYTFGGVSSWSFPTAVPAASTGYYCTSTTAGVMSFAQVAESQLTFTDITTNNASTTKHGFAPKYPNDATKYLDGTGVYSVPAGTGSTSSFSRTFALMGC